MGNPLFGIDISGIIASVVGPGLLPATLRRVITGTPTPGALSGGTNPTTTDYPCRGMIDSQRRRFSKGTLVRDDRKLVLLIGDTISGGTIAPEPGDRIIIEGTTYVIPVDGTIDRDPAGATYECEVATL
jgi:hypothetical protein